MLSLEVLHVEIPRKLQNLEILLILSNILIGFQFLLIFLVICGKIFWKGAKWVEVDVSFKRNTIFELYEALELRKMGMASPPALASYLKAQSD